MLRRAIAVVLLLTLALLAAPCAPAANALHPSHACCAPSAQISPMDCCHSAAPHPATAPAQDRYNPADFEAASSPATILARPAAGASLPLQADQPDRPHPPTILRT